MDPFDFQGLADHLGAGCDELRHRIGLRPEDVATVSYRRDMGALNLAKALCESIAEQDQQQERSP